VIRVGLAAFLSKALSLSVTALALPPPFADNARLSSRQFNGSSIGPLAILVGEPGQVRKEAAIVYDVCAGMWLVGLPPKQPTLDVIQCCDF